MLRPLGVLIALGLVALAPAGCRPSIPPATPPPGPAATDGDPPPYTPALAATPETGSTVGLSISGGYDQARAVAIRVIEAVRDADERTLERLLADRLAQALPHLTVPNRSRAQVIEHALRHQQRPNLRIGPEVPLVELIDLDSIDVTPLSRRYPQGNVPEGLQPTDLFLVIQLQGAGREALRMLLPGWSIRGGMVVRPGPDPLVVAL